MTTLIPRLATGLYSSDQECVVTLSSPVDRIVGKGTLPDMKRI